MKKVNLYLSSEKGNSFLKRCVALFSVATAAVLILTTVMMISLKSNAYADNAFQISCDRKILELSESYLSPNNINNISIVEAMTDLENNETQSGLSSEESSKIIENDTEAITEKATEVAATEAVMTTSPSSISGEMLPGYSFEELGLTQMSEIPVPESIRFDENGIPLDYKYTLSGKSTTYTMGTTTATGTPVRPGVIAVNPKIIPYGTKMYIVASDGSGHVYGYSSAEDTGGFIYWDNGPLVDMYVNCWADSVSWANKPVTIYVF